MSILHAEPASHIERHRPRTLSVAYTPDSDDVFSFYAWEQGHVAIPDIQPRFDRSHISVLNHAAAAGLYDVVAVSSVMYPVLADRYWILSAGSSVGRGYGPVLVSDRFERVEQLNGKRIGVADISTTGGMLARMYVSGASFMTCPYNRIGQAILDGELDAGVMIHEELVHYPQLGLRLVRDLGAAWLEETGLPLPVGLNLVRRSLGRALAEEIDRACRASLDWAVAHKAAAMSFARLFGRGEAESFVPMFSNDDTRSLPADVRRALRLLLDRVAAMGFGPRLHEMEIIDG